jgi:hypothetical protein
MEAASVKKQVWALADELNAALGVPLITPHQQAVTEKNISLVGREKERLYITHKSVNMSTLWDLSGSSRDHRLHENRWPTT